MSRRIVTHRRSFLSCLGLAGLGLLAAGCGEAPGGPAGAEDLSNLPEGDRLAAESIEKIAEEKKAKGKGKGATKKP